VAAWGPLSSININEGPTFSEISYTLAKITEIKLEIAKSSSQKRNHKLVLKSEINP